MFRLVSYNLEINNLWVYFEPPAMRAITVQPVVKNLVFLKRVLFSSLQSEIIRVPFALQQV
jgi:hypothetical protein